MADTDEVQTPAEPVVDTPVDTTEPVETSTQSEAQDTDDVALEDIEVSLDELDDTDEPEEQEAEEPESSEPTEQEDEEVQETSDDSEDDTDSEKPKKGEPDPEMAREAFKRREAERKLREEREQRENENITRYLQEAEDDEAEYAKRQLEVQQYNIQKEKIGLVQEKLEVGLQKAVANIDLFKTGSPEVIQELERSLDDFERMYVVKDDKGNAVEVKADVFQYLTERADSIRRLQRVGAKQADKDKASSKARTIPTPSRTPKEPKKDQDLDDFDSAW